MTDKPKRTERFTMLEAKGPNNPSPEELATPFMAAMGGPPMEVPNAVLNLVAQLAAAIEPLDAGARLVALDYVSAELSRRLAG